MQGKRDKEYGCCHTHYGNYCISSIQRGINSMAVVVVLVSAEVRSCGAGRGGSERARKRSQMELSGMSDGVPATRCARECAPGSPQHFMREKCTLEYL